MIEIKERGFIPVFKNVDPTRVKIAFYLYKNGEPMTLSQISKASDLSLQLLNHHLPLLIHEGVALQIEDNDTKYYMLQPFFYDEGIMEAIFATFIPITKFIDKEESNYNQTDEAKNKIIINCIQTLIHFFNLEIEDIKKSF